MGATMTQEDLSAGLLREDQYNHIDDPESLKYIYDNFFRSKRTKA